MNSLNNHTFIHFICKYAFFFLIKMLIMPLQNPEPKLLSAILLLVFSAEYERVIREVKEVLFGKSFVDVHEKKELVSIFHFLNQEPD